MTDRAFHFCTTALSFSTFVTALRSRGISATVSVSLSKECIDTLNQNMSERRDFLVIIAGYEGIFCGLSAMYTGLAQVINEVYLFLHSHVLC